MKFDVSIYNGASKKIAQQWYLNTGIKDQKSAIINISLLTGVPCIVSALWIGEIDGWPQFTTDAVTRLKKYYGYTSIIGAPESAPAFLFE